jgi:multiple antibiotic resistance protein
VGFFWLFDAGVALAADVVATHVEVRRFPVKQVFTFLFLMLGPFKIIGPFAMVTQGADPALTRRIALWATLFSTIALLVAAFLGEGILSSYGIPLPVLSLAAGLILFLVALINILQQFRPPTHHDEQDETPVPLPTMKAALTPLAFPAIVTPYGIAALVVFLALSPDSQSRLLVGAVVLAIMLLNLFFMLMTRHMLPVLTILMPILGAVLGIVQVALGLQIINNSLRALGLT